MDRLHAYCLVWLGLTVVLVGVLAGAVLVRPVGGQADYQLVRWTTASGLYVISQPGGPSAQAVVGEPGAGLAMSGARYTLTPGFLAAQAAQVVRVVLPTLLREAEP